ncbi:MAG TPA: phosphodiester glycosidase family protein [Acidimicrobiales bacterium]|nr:phosphodiester glycosidase family protein [Acidimicrobiales bacterium]
MRRLTVVATLVAAGLSLAATGSATTTTTTTARTSSGPKPICVGAGATRHCSRWAARDTWAGRPVYTAQFVPDPATPAVRVYAAWLRSSAVDLALYPGYKGPDPNLTLPRGPEMVPLNARPRLLATFNSGFYEYDSAAGFYTNHLLYHPMIRGLATVVRYSNGKLDVLAWTGGPTPAPNVVMARQNLNLLVGGGRPTARAADDSLWGVTLGGVPAVWRTALGVTAQGDLVYAAAPEQTSATLARIMVDLHCVRAMQLDINPAWPIFVTYARPGAVGPTLIVPNPNQIPGRFLYSSTKDFFAVFVSRHPGEAQPW